MITMMMIILMMMTQLIIQIEGWAVCLIIRRSTSVNIAHCPTVAKFPHIIMIISLNYCLDCFQRLILHLNILLHEHFQVKSESIDTETIPISLKLSPAQPGPLDHLLFHQLSTASAKQKCFLSLHSLKYDKKITFTPGFASSTHS